MPRGKFAVLFALLVVAAFAIASAGCTKPAEQPSQVKPAELLPPSGEENLPPIVPDCWALKGEPRDACFAKEAVDKAEVNSCYLIVDNETKEGCVYGFALKNPELCADMSGGRWDDCYLSAAASTSNRGMCELIFDAAKKAQCVGRFRGPCDWASPVGYNRSLCEANVSKNVSKCMAGTAWGDACTFDYARMTNDGGACQIIGDEALKYSCLTLLSENGSFCGSAKQTEKEDLCLIIVARERGNTGPCNSVSLGTAGPFDYAVQGTISYLVRCYAEVGIRLKDYTVCQQLASSIDRDSCYDAVARGALLPASCGKIYKLVSDAGSPIITTKHDVCYRDVAKGLGDPSVCNPIVDIATRDRFCYSTILAGRNAELKEAYNFTLAQCLAISEPDVKWTCVSELARRGQNSTMCELIPDGGKTAATKSTCFQKSSFSANVQNYSDCATLPTEIERDGCYRDVAKRLGDPTICNYVVNNITKDRFCYAQIISGLNGSGQNYTYTLEQCMNITQENRKWDCVMEFAARAQDKALCERIPASASTVAVETPYRITVTTKGLCMRKAGG